MKKITASMTVTIAFQLIRVRPTRRAAKAPSTDSGATSATVWLVATPAASTASEPAIAAAASVERRPSV